MNIEKLRIDKDYLYDEKNELVAFVTNDKLDFILDLDLNLKLEITKWFGNKIKYNTDKLQHILQYDSLETMLNALPELVKVDNIDFKLVISKNGSKYVVYYINEQGFLLLTECVGFDLKEAVYNMIGLLKTMI